jgi:lysozyme
VDVSALPPAIDLELQGTNHDVESPAQFQRELSEFINILTAHYGRSPVIYASADFRKHYLQGIPMDAWWVSDVIFPHKQHEEEKWNFWQFSWRGRISGVTGFVDMDVFRGSGEEFESFLHRQ